MEIYKLWIPRELCNIIEFYQTKIKHNEVVKDIINYDNTLRYTNYCPICGNYYIYLLFGRRIPIINYKSILRSTCNNEC